MWSYLQAHGARFARRKSSIYHGQPPFALFGIGPYSFAPFKVAILNLKQGADDTDAACEQLYRELTAKGVDVLYDDTDQRAGAKFAAADLIGIPWQILVGPKGLAEGKLEVKRRSDGARENLSPAEVVARLTS